MESINCNWKPCFETGASTWTAMESQPDEMVVPMPAYSSESEVEEDEEPPPSGSVGEQMAALLRSVVAGHAADVAPRLLQVDFWRQLGARDGLHVCALSALGELPAEEGAAAATLRDSLDLRGYCQAGACAHDDDVLARVKCGLRTLKERGFAPAFIYVYDEAWQVLEHSWRLLGHVLSPDAPHDVVLEPSLNAHVLTRPPAPAEAAEANTSEIQRHTSMGGAFPLPHRDHSSADCFDQLSGQPLLLSLWVPLTEVTADNGAMFVVPREADALLRQPNHPMHLLPFDQHSRRCHFEPSAAVALAPLAPGTALAWLGSSIHWGGVCSRHAQAEPRASLTAGVRVRGARATALQEQQASELPELSLADLPLPLEERVRYACGSVQLYSWWYGLGSGVLPSDATGTLPVD